MNSIQYIMVTDWDLHWDKLEQKWRNSTLYTYPLIKDGLETGPWPSEVSTLFIKLTKEKTHEKCWTGKSKNFRVDPNNGKTAIRFEVSDLKEVSCPDEYKNYRNGWHLNKIRINNSQDSIKKFTQTYENLQPEFFKEMESCSWEIFELNCFRLLRLLGIHDIHKFPQADNKGRADGFFKFFTLAAIYDATIDPNYLPAKEQQIENYINQLKKDKIRFLQRYYTIKDAQKQVWIITRGKQVKNLKIEDQIKVKEIPYTKLIEIYLRRLQEDIVMDDFCDLLENII